MPGPGRGSSPRWGRLGAAVSAFVVTLVAVLGGVGLLPGGPSAATTPRSASAQTTPTASSLPSPSVSVSPPAVAAQAMPPADALPARSGQGKRVVFDISDQRVWLVGADDDVDRTYLVSGSVTDNLRAGTFSVYSTARWAVGVDDSGVMQYFVRFTRGVRAAIGFHSIPTKNGQALQTRAQLGTPQSHGCIRQWLPDAVALWDFAPVGTKVVVTA